MGLSKRDCERLGIGHLFPSGAQGRRGGKAAHVRFAMNQTEARDPACVEFWVPGRPYGWKHHEGYGRYAKKPTTVAAWQLLIAVAAAQAMSGATMFGGPVRFSADFFLLRRPGRPPDRTNLGKAAEDACQGVVFANDTQVVGGDVCRSIAPESGLMADVEGVRIRVESEFSA